MSFFVIILYINILKQFWYKVSSLIYIVFLYSDTLLVFYWVSSNLVGINFQYSLYIPFFASWKTITYKCWHV